MQLEIQPDCLVIKKSVNIEELGIEDYYTKKIDYDDFGEMKDIQISLQDISVEKDETNDCIQSVKIDITAEESIDESDIKKNEDVPPVPDPIHDPRTETDQKRYEALKRKSSQAHTVRKIVYENGELTRGEIKEMLNEMGYKNIKPGEQHGTVNGTLRVLETVTGEIERVGRGDDKIIRWTGKDD